MLYTLLLIPLIGVFIISLIPGSESEYNTKISNSNNNSIIASNINPSINIKQITLFIILCNFI